MPADTATMLPQHHTHNPCRVSHTRGLASSTFARHYSRNHILFSLPMGTEMFHFPTFPPHRLYIHRAVTPHNWCWVSPFGHPRITARLTTPRGLSRPTTSFIGSWYQGIHRTPLNTYNNTHKHTPTTTTLNKTSCRRRGPNVGTNKSHMFRRNTNIAVQTSKD